jgi:gluconolactonase
MKIRELATGLLFPEGPVALDDGSVLLVEIARGTLSRVTTDGRVQVVADLGGGPNGAAIGADGAVYICNNGGFEWTRDPGNFLRPIGQAHNYSGGRIERVNLNTGRAERLYDNVDGIGLRGPNDLVFDGHGGFWFTDLGKGRHRDLDRGGVFYARADGSAIQEVIYPMMTPNGIGLSPDGQRLYVAETQTGRVWAFDIEAPGVVKKLPFPAPNGGTLLAGMSTFRLFDSLAVDSGGNVCVASLFEAGITVIPPDGGPSHLVPMPDLYTTNICFGGKDRRTAYVTLSGTGKLIAIDDWPIPGLALNYNG